MKEPTSKPGNIDSVDGLKLSWRGNKYHRFYSVVDQLVDELQGHTWGETGKPKRRLKGDGLEKLHYSVECLVRDCVAVVLTDQDFLKRSQNDLAKYLSLHLHSFGCRP